MTTTDPLAGATAQYQQYMEIAQITSLAELVQAPSQPQTYFTAPPVGFVSSRHG